jgi:hypothetical protein
MCTRPVKQEMYVFTFECCKMLNSIITRYDVETSSFTSYFQLRYLCLLFRKLHNFPRSRWLRTWYTTFLPVVTSVIAVLNHYSFRGGGGGGGKLIALKQWAQNLLILNTTLGLPVVVGVTILRGTKRRHRDSHIAPMMNRDRV